MAEDEMVGWYHRVNSHGFGQTPGNSDGQGRLACCSPWGLKVGHDIVTEQKQQEFLYQVKFSALKFPGNWSSERKYESKQY